MSEQAPNKTYSLHWATNTLLMSLACLAIGWINANNPAVHPNFDNALVNSSVLIWLVGLQPFFMRRNYFFTLMSYQLKVYK